MLTPDDTSLVSLEDLRAAPRRRTPTELLRHLERIDAIRAQGLSLAMPAGLPSAPLSRLARTARTSKPANLAVLQEPRRTATLAALFQTLEAVALDDAVELFDALATDIFSAAEQAHRKSRLRSLRDLDAAAVVLRDVSRRVVQDDDLPLTGWRDALFEQIPRADIEAAVKTLHMLGYIDSEESRRLTQLNHHELRHRLARRVCHGDRGEIRKAYRQEQEEQLGALGLTLNAIALWNSTYIQAALDQLAREGWDISRQDVARISPLAFKHINFLGRYAFDLPEAVAGGALRPLRNPTSE